MTVPSSDMNVAITQKLLNTSTSTEYWSVIVWRRFVCNQLKEIYPYRIKHTCRMCCMYVCHVTENTYAIRN